MKNDIPKTLKIKVIPEDFKGAQFVHNQDCPIARAVVRDLCIAPDPELFGVSVSFIRFLTYGTGRAEYRFPYEKTRLVKDILSGDREPQDISITLTLEP